MPVVACVYLHSIEYPTICRYTPANGLWAETWATNRYLNQVILGLLLKGGKEMFMKDWYGAAFLRGTVVIGSGSEKYHVNLLLKTGVLPPTAVKIVV